MQRKNGGSGTHGVSSLWKSVKGIGIRRVALRGRVTQEEMEVCVPRPIIDSTRGGESEVKRWFEEGKTYREMVDLYREQYNLEVSQTMFSNRRALRGWTRRHMRDDELIPWAVKPEHRNERPVVMLRVEARVRAGLPITDAERSDLAYFREQLEEKRAVVHYDPDTERGFFYVPREAGDADIIRRPSRGRSTRLARD